MANPTSVRGEHVVQRKVGFGVVDTVIKDGDYLVYPMKSGWPLIINGLSKLNLKMDLAFKQEKTKNNVLESEASELRIRNEMLEHRLGKEGEGAVKQFVDNYQAVRPFVKEKGGK